MTERQLPHDKMKEAPFQARYPFAGEFVSFCIDPSRVRQDFVNEAVNQGIDVISATVVAQNTRFFFERDEFREHFIQKGQTAFGRLKRRAFKLGYGLVEENNGNPDLFLDIFGLVKAAETSQPLSRYPGGRPFSKQEVLQLFLSQVWTHERQHLIQIVRDGRIVDSSAGIIAKAKAGVATLGLAAFCGSSTWTASSEESVEYMERGAAVFGVALASGVALRFLNGYRTRHSPPEREAYAKEEMFAKLPFQVAFS